MIRTKEGKVKVNNPNTNRNVTFPYYFPQCETDEDAMKFIQKKGWSIKILVNRRLQELARSETHWKRLRQMEK